MYYLLYHYILPYIYHYLITNLQYLEEKSFHNLEFSSKTSKLSSKLDKQKRKRDKFVLKNVLYK